MGVPVGSDLEYADEVTMGKAMAGRREGLGVGAAPAGQEEHADRGPDEHPDFPDQRQRHAGRAV